MAKKSYRLVQLVNEEQPTKTKYVIRKPLSGQKASEKIRLRKFDNALLRHCWFSEKRLPSPKK